MSITESDAVDLAESVVRWAEELIGVRKRRKKIIGSRQPPKAGRLKLTLKVVDNEELVGWILSFGGAPRMTHPDAG